MQPSLALLVVVGSFVGIATSQRPTTHDAVANASNARPTPNQHVLSVKQMNKEERQPNVENYNVPVGNLKLSNFIFMQIRV